MRSSHSLLKDVRTGLPILARLAAAGITTVPALRKFMQYPAVVAEFRAWGLPWPEVSVLLAGTVEILALATVALGLGGRFGASALALVMVVAMSTAGPNPLNGIVFVSAVVIVFLGTGRYSVWDPTLPEITQIANRIPSEGV